MHSSSSTERKALMITAVLELLRKAYRRSPITALKNRESRSEEEPKFEIRSDSITVVVVYKNIDMTGMVRLPRRDSLASAFKYLLSLNVYILTSCCSDLNCRPGALHAVRLSQTPSTKSVNESSARKAQLVQQVLECDPVHLV